MVSGGELPYQQLCSEITQEFNDCSKQVNRMPCSIFFFFINKCSIFKIELVQVLEMESLFMNPDYGRTDLAQLLRAVQEQEKQKLHLV